MSVSSRLGRLATVIALLVTGAFLLSACGGDSDSNSDSTFGSGSVDREDFVAEADAICAEFSDQADAMGDDYAEAIDAGDLDAAATLLDDTLDEMSSSIDEVDELERPEGDEEAIEEWQSLNRELLEITRELPDAVRDGDEEAQQDISDRSDEVEAQADEIADDLGMDDCGSDSDSDSDSGSSSGSASTEEFVAEANEICADYAREAAPAQQALTEASAASDMEGLASASEDLANSMQDMTTELEGLDVPEDDEAEIQDWLSTMRETVDLMGEIPGGYRSGDSAQLLEDSEQLTELVGETDEKSDALGVDECSSVI